MLEEIKNDTDRRRSGSNLRNPQEAQGDGWSIRPEGVRKREDEDRESQDNDDGRVRKKEVRPPEVQITTNER